MAVAEARGPEAGLTLLDGLDDQLPDGHRLPAVRAELLVRAGRPEEAAEQFDLAIARCGNEVEREHLSRRRPGDSRLRRTCGPLGVPWKDAGAPSSRS